MESQRAHRARRKPARIVLAHPLELARLGLRSFLGDVPELEIVGEAASAREVIALCQQHCPDLLVAEENLLVMDAVATVAILMRVCPHIRIIVLTDQATPGELAKLLPDVVSGFLSVRTTRQQLLAMVQRVIGGEQVPPTKSAS